jgi:hypothetical protein
MIGSEFFTKTPPVPSPSVPKARADYSALHHQERTTLFGRTEHWCQVQSVFIALLGNFPLAEGAASSILLRTLDVTIYDRPL